ncbi:MAG TPA: hypothetical protein VGG75_05640 [Trebonia sp.]|jgi:hypothetical protein
MRLARFDRPTFLERRWSYQPGQHVTAIQPTGGGKTYWLSQLLQASGMPGVMLVMKPKDPEPARWTRILGYREVAHWPPPPRWPWQDKPAGYTLWPRQSLTDLDADEDLLQREFGKALTHVYSHGNGIAFADEVGGLCELRLQKQLKALWMRGRAMHAGLWCATQKPSGDQGGPAVPTYLYSAASHLFLGYDPTKANRQRFSEIGGVDPAAVTDAVRQLRLIPVTANGITNYVSEQLHIMKGGRKGAYMCIVEPW